MIRRSLLYLLLSLSPILWMSAQAQSSLGSLNGVVLDELQEGLPGVNIWVQTLEKGTSTDLDGRFLLEELPAGRHSLVISYISYQTQTLEVEISSSSPTELKITLLPEDTKLEEVEVVSERLSDNEFAITDLRRKSLHTLEGLSATQMKRFGDNNLGSAMQRMTGVTVEDGTYVYVRGLGDRYSKTFLNGANIPGLDPDRNSVQMDIFPAHLLENVVVYKTFSAQLPGDFTGGYIDISTKSVPEGPTLHFSTSVGYNPTANLNSNTLTYTGSSTDWLGMDDGLRARPSILDRSLPGISRAERDEASAAQLNAATRAFGSQEMRPYRQSMPLNQRYLLSFGNRYRLFDRPIGYLFTLSHQRSFDSYTSPGLSGVYRQRTSTSPTLSPLLALEDFSSGSNVLWGALFSTGYHISPRHRLTLGLMHNQKGTQTARQQTGSKPEDDPDLRYYTQGLWYTQKGVSTAQLKGTHDFGFNNRFSIDWISSHTLSRIYQPDLRFFTYGDYGPQSDGSVTYYIQPALGQLPTRYFRDMNENLSDFRLHLTHRTSSRTTLKAGGALSLQQRVFEEDQYRYSNFQIGIIPDGNPDAYISDNNLWSYKRTNGVYLVDATIAANNYEASQRVWASYLLTEQQMLGKRLTLIAGLRYEGTDMNLESKDQTQDKGQLQLHDLLPSLQLNYKTYADRIVLRAAYGRTIARPSFRELAPFASFDFIGDYILVGNPNLTRTRIDNYDYSAEYYPRGGESITLSLFYKRFQHPIERTFNIEASTPELTFRNVPQAQVIGFETGVKKKLDQIGSLFSPLSMGANFSWIYSWVRIDEQELQLIRALAPDASSYRPMYGQAPYSVNAFLQYTGTKGFEANVSYNIFGQRISVITPGGPSIYEMPRHSLDANVSQQIGAHWKTKLSVRNILDAPFRFVQDFENTTYFTQRYQQGRTFSLSFSYIVE